MLHPSPRSWEQISYSFFTSPLRFRRPLAARVRQRRRRELRELVAEPGEERGAAPARAGAPAPSSTLSATPTPSGRRGAEQALGAALRHPARERAHQPRVGRAARRGSGAGTRASRRATAAPASSCSSRENTNAMRSSGSANVTTPQPSTAVGSSSGRRRPPPRARRGTPAARDGRRGGSRALPAARAAEREHAGVLAGAVVAEPRRRSATALELVLAPPAPSRAAPRPRRPARAAEVRGRRDREVARRRGRSRARASGSAWNGFAAERMNVTRPASPRSATTAPSCTATAWTTCRPRRWSPRRTSTLIGSATRGETYDARTTRDGGVAPPARRPGVGVPDREGRPGAHRDAEDLRPAARGARGPPARGRASGGRSGCSSRPTTASSSCSST